MKKDLEIPQVENVAVAIVKEPNRDDDEWGVYLINLKNEPISNVFVTSTGYGEVNGERLKTSTLRHFFETVAPDTAIKVEPIMDFTFGLSNEYWVSFYVGEQIYDKQYVFLPETINPSNFTRIPLLDRKGVMIG
ncbi:MAG: hypothetical protein MUC87_09430 [Bacteroidia bacterium]|jgi:hypothetical protein|nr:hypothetical protein [Bacteroidia bacterium]